MNITDFIGLLGAFFYLLSYFLLQTGKINNGYIYGLLNLAGAFFVLYSLIYSYNLASFITQISWIFISIYGLFRVYKESPGRPKFAFIKNKQ